MIFFQIKILIEDQTFWQCHTFPKGFMPFQLTPQQISMFRHPKLRTRLLLSNDQILCYLSSRIVKLGRFKESNTTQKHPSSNAPLFTMLYAMLCFDAVAQRKINTLSPSPLCCCCSQSNDTRCATILYFCHLSNVLRGEEFREIFLENSKILFPLN